MGNWTLEEVAVGRQLLLGRMKNLGFHQALGEKTKRAGDDDDPAVNIDAGETATTRAMCLRPGDGEIVSWGRRSLSLAIYIH